MLKVVVPALALILSLSAGAAAQVANLSPLAGPRDPAGTEPKGTAVIRGRVTSLDGGKPLRRARISVASPEIPSGRTASTNTDGRYEIRDLPAGRYTLRVNRSGYLPLVYGQRRPGEPGKPFELADKQVVEKVDFALPRMGVISGRVLDELGEPIAGVNMWAMQFQYFQGARRLVPMGGGLHGTSDDTGQYRLLALPPGDYIVMGQIRETWPLDSDPKQIFGYAPSYYPGTAAATEAQRVKVGVGQEVGGVDFALIPGRTVKVAGTVLSAAGLPMAGESVNLAQEVRGPTMSSMFSAASTKTGADGSFTLANVPAGEYMLSVRAPARNEQPAQEASQPLTVGGADIEGLVVVAGTGGTIRGQVSTDDGSGLPANLDRMVVRAQSLTPGSRMSFPSIDNGKINKDGTFEVKGLFGPVVLSVASLTGDRTLKAIDMEGRELADDPIDVPHGDTVSGVRVVLTNRPSYVRGGLTDEKRQPAEGTIVIFPEEKSRWREGARTVRSARPDQTGEFSFKGLPAGNYLIAALEYVQDGQWNDPEFLESLTARAERVSLADAENKRVDLTLKK
jgi:hypothetical protein